MDLLEEISINPCMDTSVCRSDNAKQFASMESLVAMVIVLLYQVWQICPFYLVARQPSIIRVKVSDQFLGRGLKCCI